VPPFGNEVKNSTDFGALKGAGRVRQNSSISASVAAEPGRSAINALGTSPLRSSGTPTTVYTAA